MKRNLIFIIFFLFNVCFGQNSETEKLVNAVVNDIIPKDYQYFNLIDSSFIYNRDYHLEDDELEYLTKEYPDFDFNKTIDKNRANKEILNWKNFKILKAKLYNFENLPEYRTYNKHTVLIPFSESKITIDSLIKNKKKYELIFVYKKYWSKKKLKKEIDKAWKKRTDNIIKENSTYYHFSTPYFSDNGYAIISVDNADSGQSYIYKKENNDWKQIHIFNRWVQ
ncbi:hypothetical protein D3C87_788320 [compost metagenome]